MGEITRTVVGIWSGDCLIIGIENGTWYEQSGNKNRSYRLDCKIERYGHTFILTNKRTYIHSCIQTDIHSFLHTNGHTFILTYIQIGRENERRRGLSVGWVSHWDVRVPIKQLELEWSKCELRERERTSERLLLLLRLYQLLSLPTSKRSQCSVRGWGG